MKSLSKGALIGIWLVFVAVTVAGGALIPGLFGWESVDYADFAQSAESFTQNIIVPLGIVTVLVVILVSVLGWWRPVMRDDRPVPRWMILVPVAMAAVALASASWSRMSELGSDYLIALVVGTLIIGFNEEVITRGVLLTGFRRLGSETSAWAWSTGLFALMHGANLFLGSALSNVLPQVLMTFLIGSLLYITRRVTGSLIAAIVLHALWDFAQFSHGTSKAEIVPGAQLFAQSLVPVVVVTMFVVVMIAHKHWMSSKEPAVT